MPNPPGKGIGRPGLWLTSIAASGSPASRQARKNIFFAAALGLCVTGIQRKRNKALSAAERNRRTAEINARILELEHEEEALVEAALDAGHDGVSRREVASPAVVLGVRVSTRARVAA